MSEPADQQGIYRGLRSKNWDYSYKTSAATVGGHKINILHDFYIPVLRLSAHYDRMAGFFRSSSLAAASQGFSAFIGKEGKMRLVVGADLDPSDVKAILDGDAKRLEIQLGKELEQPDTWPEDVRKGVGLLAWMVAHGYLEVKVAFRVHGETGVPLAFSMIEDGYVHEKWAIFADEWGNRLYVSGSLNESRSALVLNAENIDVHCEWWSERDRQRVDDAERTFENIWKDSNPFLRVMTLPEAVRRQLIKFAETVQHPREIDGTSAVPKLVEPPSPMELLRFGIIRDGPKLPGGRFVGMETAPVTPWPHQAIVARRLIEAWPYSYLLCDEVGLGKTIESGLAIRSLYLSGIIKRVLIAVPASLTMQWQRQMASKLLMPFGRTLAGPVCRHNYIFPSEEERPSFSIYEPDLVIVSTGLLTRKERINSLVSAEPFDIALIDEAHAARRKNPTSGTSAYPEYSNLYLVIRDHLRKNSRCLWLATATPMQIHPVEVCDLLELTNRVGTFQFDPTLTLQFYEILGKLVRDETLNPLEWEFLRQSVKSVLCQDPLLWHFLDKSVIDGRIRSATWQWLDKGYPPRGSDRRLMLRIIFASSPLSRVMLRHNRSLLEIYRDNNQLDDNLAQRHLLPVPTITFTHKEQDAYDSLEDYCKGLASQIESRQDSQTKQSLGFLLSFLRLRFASSLFAIRETLRRRLGRVEATLCHQMVEEAEELELTETYLEDLLIESEDEDDREAVRSLLKNRTVADLEWELTKLKGILDKMSDLSGTASKMQTLLDTLNKRRIPRTGRIKQTVIFTRFYDTLVDICDRLLRVDPTMLIGTYSGRGGQCMNPQTMRLRAVEREEVKERFLRSEIDVLVCTDAAAEGLNLQTADLLINFDLGWNPMKIEQRIGRIDRIGQRHKDVYVLNLCYAGSAEEIVYNRLLRRLTEAMAIVGQQQFSMLPVEPEEFQQLAEGKLSEKELERLALDRIRLQQERTASMEIPPEDLYEIYLRLSQEKDIDVMPIDLDAIWTTLSESRYLRDLGCILSSDRENPTLALYGVPYIPDGTLLTASRKLYEEGIPESETPIHFASYLGPCFQAILDHVDRFDFPGCIKRLVIQVPGMEQVEVIGYAVSCYGERGEREVRLLTSWKDLVGLQLCEEDHLSATDVDPLRENLQRIAIEEFQPYLAAKRIERCNVLAGWGQKILSYLVGRSLINFRIDVTSGTQLFWSIINDLKTIIEQREKIFIPDLPAGVVRSIKDKGDLLFEPTIPTVGSEASLEAPIVLIRSALDAASRLADSMKLKKSELSVHTVLSRLQREIDQNLARLVSE